MEVTLIDALLLAWAVVATVKWSEARRNLEKSSDLVFEILNNEDLRTRMLEDFNRWKAGKRNAAQSK